MTSPGEFGVQVVDQGTEPGEQQQRQLISGGHVTPLANSTTWFTF
jgi:hypothetical protein